MTEFAIRRMRREDAAGAAALQADAFPPPFSPELHWDPEHLEAHVALFPEGQLVAEADGRIVGSCSNAILPEEAWRGGGSWGETVGGPMLRRHEPNGSTLYGLDIAVHPEFRRRGIGRAFYCARFELVRARRLRRYGTGCRMPDYHAYATAHPGTTPEAYASLIAGGAATDRTLTPLLRYGLGLVGVRRGYMPDEESANAAALLEWTP